MNKADNNIVKNYQKKVKLIKKYNKFYYNNDSPKVSDAEYDKLKREIIKIEEKNKFLSKFGSVKNLVGSEPSGKFKKIKHSKPMLSLSNAFNKEDISNFLKKINNYLNNIKMKIEIFSEPKIDGISATLIYENGSLIKGISRGDGETGEDILENLKTINQIPKNIKDKNIPKILEIRGEVYIGK